MEFKRADPDDHGRHQRSITSLQHSLEFFQFERLDYVADLDVVEVGDADAALETLLDLRNVFFKAT